MSNQYRVSVYNDNTKGHFGDYEVDADTAEDAAKQVTDDFLSEFPKFQKRYLRVSAQQINETSKSDVVAESGE